MDQLVVVGSMNMDLTVKVKQLPSRGETVVASYFQASPGGKGANQAVAAARLGATATMVGRVGADSYGRALLSSLEANRVDASFALVDSECPTGTALVTVDEGGANTIVVFPGANARCSPHDIEAAESIIQGAEAIVVQLEIPLDAVEQALRIGRKHSAVTMLNPAPAQAIPQEVLLEVDVLIPNEIEATTLSGLPVGDPVAALAAGERLLRMGPRRVVITLGDQGAVFVGPEGRLHVPAFRVRAIDSTAAGDAFIAAFATAWIGGAGVERSIRYACAAGAIATTRVGAQVSLPTRDEVERLCQGRRDGQRCLEQARHGADWT